MYKFSVSPRYRGRTSSNRHFFFTFIIAECDSCCFGRNSVVLDKRVYGRGAIPSISVAYAHVSRLASFKRERRTGGTVLQCGRDEIRPRRPMIIIIAADRSFLYSRRDKKDASPPDGCRATRVSSHNTCNGG